ncbi:hypothetical protein BpHYR1_018224 [Brachionus plicatilis]|uniref:Uncharacterized protein n=1 Tax=Brachionus plicatilis TaxID=10195 RepID=A0A3M7QWY8_BRAPC|nr:hypothetical protein BpHYR1_018224 [Brachionus plicatilis]
MGNIPAKITGRYQSYDINRPSLSTPPIPVRHHDQIEDPMAKADCVPDSFDKNLLNDKQDEANFNQTSNSATNSVYNEQAVDTGENEDYVESHMSNHLENNPRQVDVMY